MRCCLKIMAGLTAFICCAGMAAGLPEMSVKTYASEVVHNSFESNYDGWYGNSDTVKITAENGTGYKAHLRVRHDYLLKVRAIKTRQKTVL